MGHQGAGDPQRRCVRALRTHRTGGRDSWRSQLGRYVLPLGGIEPRKGSLDLLEAYALLHTEHPDVRLVIAGGETLFDFRDYRAHWETPGR
ncbi:hypothetical protein ABZY05_47485 [Streptomyces canus]|uniref:hypothetical protein n=1 Tax=Streptomyces canus TaxID=58343 RepID=UPI00339E39B2